MSCVEVIMCDKETGFGFQRAGDDQLLAAYRNGDGDAATELFSRYYARLLGLARKEMGHMLRSVEESIDIAQSVFKSIFKRARTHQIDVPPDKSLWPLLATITVNRIRDHRRYWMAMCRDLGLAVPLEDWDPLEPGPGDADFLAAKELKDQIIFASDSPRWQEAIELLFGDVPIKEIAGRLGICRRTVSRIRKDAAQILERILAAP